jgi:hypothetical protein
MVRKHITIITRIEVMVGVVTGQEIAETVHPTVFFEILGLQATVAVG